MKNLLKFSNVALSLEEKVTVKGGIRFITTDKEAYKLKKKELKDLDIDYVKTKVKDEVTKIKTYCIEW